MYWLWKICIKIIRDFLRKRAGYRVLVLGDSHIRVFEHWLFLLRFPKVYFQLVYVPGGTALGICNPGSKTQARARFEEALAADEYDLVLINLGEVDTAYTIWRRAEISGGDPYLLLDRAVKNYCSFLSVLRKKASAVAVISAPLPTLSDQSLNDDDSVRVRGSVKISQHIRTEATLIFNNKIRLFCHEHEILYLNGDEDALGPDGLVRPEWVESKRIDHHYARRPYASWLVSKLKNIDVLNRKS